jgi:two-component system, NtrC family, sensor kinase
MAVEYKLYPILFVDDEPQNLVVFRYAMEEHFTVLTAQTGKDALQIMQRQQIAVLLADQRMPEMNGAELCARAREVQPEAVRIIITAYADIHAAIDAINKGQVSRYLVKPWRNEELMEVLQTAIEFVHLQHAMRDMEMRLLRSGQSRIATAVHDEVLHEIANPLGAMTMTLNQASDLLTVVLAHVESAGDKIAPELKTDLLELKEVHGDALAAVDQLNALAARMRAGPTPLRAMGLCDAGRVTDATVRIIRREVERFAGLQVVLEESPVVGVEASALGQIVLNLVLNAAQSIEGSGVAGCSIRITVGVIEGMASVAVSDSGPGIPSEILERIFEPYFTTKTGGSGLGLSIVREMVWRAGGQIAARSNPGVDTTFEVRLPLADPS